MNPVPASSAPTAALVEPFLRCSRLNAVFHIELNRPASRNPLGAEMVEALSAAVAEASADSLVRVILLTAAGDTFSAGGNLGNLSERLEARPGADGQDPIAAGNRRYGSFLAQLAGSGKTSVVAVHGPAMGGGAGLVCAADIAIGTTAARFGFPETSIGLVPGQILPFVAARIGVQAARRLMLTCERIDGTEAHRIGLLDYCVSDAEQLRARTDAVISSLVACAPVASATTKALLRDTLAMAEWHADGLRGYLDQASTVFARQMRTEAVVGIVAARGKHRPDWHAVRYS